MYEEAPAADPRALLSAAALGSIAGLMLGGAYLMSGRLQATPNFAEAPALAAAASVAAGPAAPPRARLRWLPFTAQEPQSTADAAVERDRQCLTQAVYYEARGEVAAGQEAVAQVVLNRVRHPAFPKSVCAVVFQRNADGCQFSFACEGHPAVGRDAAAWRRAGGVADRALDGFVMRQIGHATHFHVFNIDTQWSQSLARVAQIGAHVFYGFTRHPTAVSPRRDDPPTIRVAPEPAPSAAVTMASLDTTPNTGPVASTPQVAVAAAPLTATPGAGAAELITTTTR